MSERTVAVILRSGAALLLRRAPGQPDAGRWEFPSGPIGPSETPAAAAARVLLGLGMEGAIGAEAARARAGETELIALLVSKPAGEPALAGHDQAAWVETRRLLERDLVAEQIPIAEALAAHRRRERYRGTHPRRFGEKYKELAADPEAIAKAKARGSTPAGAHVPVMLAEALEAAAPLATATILDCTLGWGGHAEAFARAAGSSGRVIGLDRDAAELARTAARLERQGVSIVCRHANYADACVVLRELGVPAVDVLLADLGVSSMQLDRPERGMSFKQDGPLDMRMDASRGPTAAEWLASASEDAIGDALARFGDEPDAKAIAAELARLAARGRAPTTTAALVAAVAAAKGLAPGRITKKDAFSFHPAARTFQALRIAVNGERESLARLLAGLPGLLRPGGRALFLTFHSGEEALVGAALREQAAKGSWRTVEAPRKPSPEEIWQNPRARSARLWRAVRAEDA